MEFTEFVGFVRQLGLALAGAASLWGCVFLFVARKKNVISGGKRATLEWASERLLLLFSIGFVLAIAAWITAVLTMPVFGHEGVTVYPAVLEYLAAFRITFPVYTAWVILSLAMFLFYFTRRARFVKFLPHFFAAQLLFTSFLISMYAWSGEILSDVQFFYYFHGFHSIMTIGTVITLDFLFLSSRRSPTLQRNIFPFFPQISKVIWIGLGLDFLSAIVVFGSALELSPRFFLAQTVVSILIINGAFLSGPLTRKILSGLKQGVEPLKGRWQTIAAVSGSVSIISWLTITFIDFFPNITLSYPQLIGIYFTAIVVAFVVNIVVDKLDLGVATVPAELRE